MQVQDYTAPPLTYEDLLETPYDRNRYEIIDGEMFMSASPNRGHQLTAQTINLVLVDASDRGRHGLVLFAPVDVRLSPHDIVQPDLLFIRRDRIDIYTERGLVDGPPDIVVEILSPGSHTRDLVKKAKLYAWAGVPEYWQADPLGRELTILGLNRGHYETVPTEGGQSRSLVLPHLRIDIATIFADV